MSFIHAFQTRCYFLLRFVSVSDVPTAPSPTPTASIVSLLHTRKSSFIYNYVIYLL